MIEAFTELKYNLKILKRELIKSIPDALPGVVVVWMALVYFVMLGEMM